MLNWCRNRNKLFFWLSPAWETNIAQSEQRAVLSLLIFLNVHTSKCSGSETATRKNQCNTVDKTKHFFKTHNSEFSMTQHVAYISLSMDLTFYFQIAQHKILPQNKMFYNSTISTTCIVTYIWRNLHFWITFHRIFPAKVKWCYLWRMFNQCGFRFLLMYCLQKGKKLFLMQNTINKTASKLLTTIRIFR